MTKETLQKIIAGVLFLGLLIYSYFNFLLGPVNSTLETVEAEITELEDKLLAAKGKIAATNKLEKEGKAAQEYLIAAEEYFKEGTPIAWFPPMIKAFYQRMGIERTVVSNLDSRRHSGKAMSNYVSLRWEIQLPQTDFFTIGNLMAAIENEQPFSRIERLSITRNTSNPEFQLADMVINFTNKIPK